jgi:hypothetical protein
VAEYRLLMALRGIKGGDLFRLGIGNLGLLSFARERLLRPVIVAADGRMYGWYREVGLCERILWCWAFYFVVVECGFLFKLSNTHGGRWHVQDRKLLPFSEPGGCS